MVQSAFLSDLIGACYSCSCLAVTKFVSAPSKPPRKLFPGSYRFLATGRTMVQSVRLSDLIGMCYSCSCLPVIKFVSGP